MSALAALATALRDEGGLVAAATVDPADDADRSASDGVRGPRAEVAGDALRLAVEATREAELLHHAPERARVVRTDDRDLALLAGDRLYALGLERLAADGLVDEVRILADVVALVARLHAGEAWALGAGHDGGTGAPDAAAARTAALWICAGAALGRGSRSPAAALLRTARTGATPTPDALRAAAAAVNEG
ncbi:hypothetical protein [Patulibacter defluvii]|uniref:hypothetical protein n=1 Tax=Patulibacter defluvii TaxID=3095358 RepID=UPI002A748778|nr:hypothetical protein [Patulibacter sp. DM4]